MTDKFDVDIITIVVKGNVILVMFCIVLVTLPRTTQNMTRVFSVFDHLRNSTV